MTSETIENDGLNFEEIEKDVKKTSFGQWLLDNTQLVVAAMVWVTVISLGFVWFGKWQESKKTDSASAAYEFEITSLKEFTDKKINSEAVIQGYTNLSTSLDHKSALIPLSLKLSSALVEQDGKYENAINVLASTIDLSGSNTKGVELLRVQLASLYEDNNQADKSIEVFETIKKSLPEYMGAYVYFHLGRIYKSAGNTVAAKEHLNFVVEKYKDTEEAKLAGILLTEF